MAVKVLITTAYFESHRGGIEIVAGKLARELRSLGAHVTWLATDASPPPPSLVGVAPAHQVSSGSGSGASACDATLPVAAWNITERRLGVPLPLPAPRAAVAVWRAVAAADVVWLHDSLYPTNVIAMFAARWHRKPVVLTQHIAAVPYTNPVLRAAMRTANVLIARPMLAAADQVVFISAVVAQHFSGLGFKAQPQLIFNGVDTGLFGLPGPAFDRAAVRARHGLPSGTRLVLFVGRFVEKKGLRVIEHVARSRPDLTFALAGWGPIDPTTWALPNVRVLSDLGPADLAPLYQAADLLLLPSIGEGLPLVLQEALACGLPVICGAETAVADPEATAFVEAVAVDMAAPDRTAAACSAAIDRILARDETADQDRMARHTVAKTRYSWRAGAQAYLVLLESLSSTASPVTQAARPVQSQDTR